MDIEELEKKYASLDAKLEHLLSIHTETIQIYDVSLKDALKSQIRLELEFGTILSKIKFLFSMVDDMLEETQNELVSTQMKSSYSDIKLQEAKVHALSSSRFKDVKFIHTNIKGLLSDATVAYDTVISRKYILNNLTNATISSVENHLL